MNRPDEVAQAATTNDGFTLVIEGIPASDDGFLAFANAVYGVAPDSTVSMGRVGFDHGAAGLREAVISAEASVRKADPSVTVVGVILDDGGSLDTLLTPVASAAAVAG